MSALMRIGCKFYLSNEPRANRASLEYRDPLLESWLLYRKNSRAVIVPKSGAGDSASFACKRENLGCSLSPFLHSGAPDPPPVRARVRCGLNDRSSAGMPM